MKNEMITMDSFGQDLPMNWEEIANYMNDRIENGQDSDDVWNDYWNRYHAGDLEDGEPVPQTIEDYADEIEGYIDDHAPFTWPEYNALPLAVRDGVEDIWEPGYDYSDVDFWTGYTTASMENIHAVQMYDWLKENDPEGEDA